MASSSTSSMENNYKYDVFLSFRGEDTRKNFVDHLYTALRQQGIHTFKDDERLEKGKRIKDELFKSIEDSKFCIIVFSMNYASSSWCLDELVKIMECQKTTGLVAYPVFYDVDPSEVRKQLGTFGDAFAKHNREEVGKWRGALEAAGNLSGWDLRKLADGHEAKVIKIIVEQICLKLRSLNLSVDENLIGIEPRIKDVELSLEIGLDDVRMIGINGIGGGGKTTLARAVFDKISIQFEGISFVENVREVSKASGLQVLQKHVLSDVLNEPNITVQGVHVGINMMKTKLRGKKVLLVLDDVDHISQLEALAGEPTWFMRGSRIIITTRDKQVLVAHKVKWFHEVNLLSNGEAICLFSRCAFGTNILMEGYKQLSLQIIHYAAGLPLTIKVLGSSLCGKDKPIWIDVLKRLKKIPLKETLQILELSYIGLDDDHKEIFLDIACFLKGMLKEDAIRILESCGFNAIHGLDVLEDKSVITILDQRLGMHDHIQELGRNIVRRFHPDEPSRHSRLWIREEVEDILVNDLGTEATTAIAVNLLELGPNIVTNGFGKMKKLRFLRVKGQMFWSGEAHQVSVNIPRENLPHALRYLSWTYYRGRCLPKMFQANNLVALEMQYSKIVQLWEGGERKVLLNKLRFMNLNHSRELTILDLEMTPNLERLNLEDCISLAELHGPHGCLKRLVYLNLSHSKKLTILDLGMTPNLEKLDLAYSENLVKLQWPDAQRLVYLNLSHSKMLTILDLRMTPNLEKLDLAYCENLVNLQLPDAQKLVYLNLSHSKMLTILDLGMTPNLETLDLPYCEKLVKVHAPDGCLQRLVYLNLSHSKQLTVLDLGMTPNLEKLDLTGCYNLVKLHVPIGFLKRLVYLNLSHSIDMRILDLGMTPNLEKLDPTCCYDFVKLHTPVGFLKNLVYLNLSGSINLTILDLGMTPNLEKLDLQFCENLVKIHAPDGCLRRLVHFNLGHSEKLTILDLGMTPNLEKLDLQFCKNLVKVHAPDGCLRRLVHLNLRRSEKLKILDLGMTPNLEKLDLQFCENLVKVHAADGYLQRLVYLKLTHSKKLLILDLGMTPNLEKLDLTYCYDLVKLHAPVGFLKRLVHLDLSFAKKLSILDLEMTPNLEKLDLTHCYDLVKLHAPVGFLKKLVNLNLSHSRKLTILDLGMAPNLEKLNLSKCEQIRDIPNSICKLKRLRYLDLFYCVQLETLPEELGCLECLEELDVRGTRISHLP